MGTGILMGVGGGVGEVGGLYRLLFSNSPDIRTIFF